MEERVLEKGQRMGCGHLVAKKRRVFGDRCWDCSRTHFVTILSNQAPLYTATNGTTTTIGGVTWKDIHPNNVTWTWGTAPSNYMVIRRDQDMALGRRWASDGLDLPERRPGLWGAFLDWLGL